MKNIKWWRATLAGLAANVASFFVGGGGYLLFGWTFKLEPVSVWRWTPEQMWEMPPVWWICLIAGNTILGIVVAYGYAVLYHGIPGQGWKKGTAFGLIFWFVAVLPIVFTVHILTLINQWSILYMTCQSLVELVTYGIIIAVIYGSPAEESGQSSC
jgi:hypothetical protein